MPLTPIIQPGFHAIHANHLEDLRRSVVWICRQQPVSPLASETFLVQSNGIAQWLKLALAEDPEGDADGGMGIAAGMDFLFPSRFIWQAYRAVLPAEEVPEQSPFDKSRLVWRLFRLLPTLVHQQEVFAPLQRFLEGSDPDTRCYQLAGQIADLFDQYQVFRADWLTGWENGQDFIELARGEVRQLEDDQRWQPVLWRALVADVGELSATSRSRIHTRFMEHGQKLTASDRPANLPQRIVVFGVSSLPRQTLEALSVLSRISQVVLCVHNPCEYFWADIISDRDLLTASRRRGKQHKALASLTDPDQLHQHANPLLAAWGKQGRDYIRLLDEFDDPETYDARVTTPDGRIDIFTPHGTENAPRVLHQIQDDVRSLTSSQEMQRESRQLAPNQDQSIAFHRTHSPQREVEVLHDQLLAAFSADENLRPRDIIVMVPDINAYAPHIQAVFGRYSSGASRYIPFTISDQQQRHRQPVLIALDTLMSLPDHRFGASEIISLLEVPAVRRRFDIAEADLPLVRQWVEGANVRWGLHAEHRRSFDLPTGLSRNTWQSGLRRMLLGYGTGPDEAWQGIEPYGEIGGLQATLAGNLVRFVERLEHLWEELAKPYTPEQWLAVLQAMLEGFFAEFTDDEQLLINRLRRQAEQWYEDCTSGGMAENTLPLSIVREELLEGLEEGGLNQRFLAGKVNFATLMPMRAIPFKRVCLLGMNDGDYPRSRPPVDFDLMAQDSRPGDRSRREDDRYLFLEAMLSAREQLYISWVGRSIRDDSERPPSVLVSQLRDHLDAVWSVTGEESASDALTTEHPLQPFSRDYFPAAQQPPGQRRLFSYDEEWLQAHQSQHAEDHQPLPYLPPAVPLTCQELAEFLKKPVETFYRRRLQLQFISVQAQDTDNETFSLDGLKHWTFERELIDQAVVKAVDETDLEHRLQERLNRMTARGDLGMGAMESVAAQQLYSRMPDLFVRYQKALADWPQMSESAWSVTWSVKTRLGSVELADRIGQLRTRADGDVCRVVIANSSLLEKNGGGRAVKYSGLLDDWVIHLAGCTQSERFHTLVLGKEENRQILLAPVGRERAAELLEQIMVHWIEGQTYPLPIEPATAYGYLRGLNPSGKKEGSEALGLERAEQAFQSTLAYRGIYLGRAYPDFESLQQAGDFAGLVRVLYEPLWQCEYEGREAKAEPAGSAS
ncbi:exodeoxyribonuclease V subunit gamma [Marinobacter sp. CHS3-4]|uniref:exodeoxyribonuclease V subunit gamma n=1 Tax=Marinobacter sp. CHS3-4 TaxID=3045174 RepID=UPI0024B52B12|nr:exodeoxyribonuclease V subunit gamma [Marinobacter sp. CHS3-4]MDI9246339.1 exodeoxyribonuclease V subunit gamma [Marinobacter sp. CHS3-4]